MPSTIALAARETATLTAMDAAASGIYGEVTLGQDSHLIVDGAELAFRRVTLQRLGSRIIELRNGAQLHVCALGLAGAGASIVYRIGAGCVVSYDTSQWDPEVGAHTTFDLAGKRLN